MSKEKCDCGKMAIWIYMPGYSGGGNPYICDDCISSVNDIGCSCNWHETKNSDPEGEMGQNWRYVDDAKHLWINLDKRGRPYPCAEYEYDADGFDKPTIISKLYDDLWWKFHEKKRNVKRWWGKIKDGR